MNTISVIIPTCNRPMWLARAIESVLAQTYPYLETIVIDDGSESLGIPELVAKYENVKYIYEDRKGAGAARNTGLAASHGNYIQFLDDDDWLEPQAIQNKLEVFLQYPDTGIVYSDLFLANEAGDTIGNFYSDRKRPLPAGKLFPLLARRNFIPIHAALWKREIIEAVGGFPCRTGAEDWEALIRASEITAIYPIDQPLGYYRLHSQNVTLKLASQIRGDGMAQAYIVQSPNFQSLEPGMQIHYLCSYSLQQWMDGDSEKGELFYQLAKAYRSKQTIYISLVIMRFLGKPIARFMMHSLWRLRSKLTVSSGYYFLKHA